MQNASADCAYRRYSAGSPLTLSGGTARYLRRHRSTATVLSGFALPSVGPLPPLLASIWLLLLRRAAPELPKLSADFFSHPLGFFDQLLEVGELLPKPFRMIAVVSHEVSGSKNE